MAAVIHCSMCFSQSFTNVNIYIANPYVQRVDVIKMQTFNMDYVRSHYATCVSSMETNYINNLYDSIASFSLSEVAYDSVPLIVQPYCLGLEMDFEPCIVIDFIKGNRFNINEETSTFAVDRRGYVYTFNELSYPNKRFLDFIESSFPGMIFFHE